MVIGLRIEAQNPNSAISMVCSRIRGRTLPGAAVVDRAVAQRWQRIGNYAVRFCPIASNCAFCSSLSVP
jgi:hypothetical protein